MTPVEGGYFCNFCDKKVLDLTHLSESDLVRWKTENSSQCVIINEPKEVSPKMTLSHFALALLVVGGASLFNFTNAQVQSDVEAVKGELSIPEDPSLGILTVNLTNQHDYPTWGQVWVELPNGKELELYELKEGTYYVEIPSYCKGKTLVVFAEHLDKKKNATTSMFQAGEELVVNIKFHTRKSKYRYVRGKF